MTTERHCSFCGHHEADRQRLFAGTEAFICERCVEGCAVNFAGGSRWDPVARTWIEHAPLSPWPHQRQSHFGDDVTCSFCGKAELDLQWLVGCRSPNTFVCDECVGLYLASLASLRDSPTISGATQRRRRRTFRWPWQNPHVNKAATL